MKAQSKLSKKSFTVVEQACHQVRGFRNLFDELDDKVRLSGQSASTLMNYARKLAQCSRFGKRQSIPVSGQSAVKGLQRKTHG